MQTPKEKAKELYDEFIKILAITDMRSGANGHAQDCAYYITEQILGELYDMGIREEEGQRKFWYDVQDEIKQL